MLLPLSHILCSCQSTCNLVLVQNHREPQTCLHQATHSCACPSFGRLGICISQRSRGEDSHTVCSQWSSWSCVPPMRGLSILYRWFARLSVRISPDSLLPLSLNCAEWTRVGIERLALWLVVYMAKKWYFYVVTWTSSWDEFCPRCWAKCCFSVVLCCRNLRSLRQQCFYFFWCTCCLIIYPEEEKQRGLLKCWNDKDDIFILHFFIRKSKKKLRALLCFRLQYIKKALCVWLKYEKKSVRS